MSRKKRHAAGAPPTVRAPHSAVHRRRRRGIRKSRNSFVATVEEQSASIHPVVQALSNLHRAELAYLSCLAMGGMAYALLTVGAIVHTNLVFASPHAPHIQALRLFPHLFVGLMIVGAVAPLRVARIHNILRSMTPWTALAGTALACGVAISAMPFVFSLAERASQWAHAQFLLSDPLIRMLQFALLVLTCFVPACGISIILLLLNRISQTRIRSIGHRAAAIGSGACAGVFIASQFSHRPGLVLLVSSLPLLIIALIAGAIVLPEAPKTAIRAA